MKLDDMKLPDLVKLRDGLTVITSAAELLMTLDEDVQVEMIPGRPLVLTCGWIVPGVLRDDGLGDPGPCLVEPVVQVVSVATEAEKQIVQPAPAVILPKAVEKAKAVATERANAKTKARAKAEAPTPAPSLPVITNQGPLTAVERASILEMRGRGLHVPEIAARLKRRTAAVTSFLNSPSAKKAIETRGQPVPAAATAATSVAKDDPPRGGAKGEEQLSEAKPAPTAPTAGGAAPIPVGQQHLARHLDALRLPKGWDVELDLEVVEAAARGIKIPAIATDLGVDTATCQQRFHDLTSTIRDDRNWITIEGQTHLLAELRRRVAKSRGVAA